MMLAGASFSDLSDLYLLKSSKASLIIPNMTTPVRGTAYTDFPPEIEINLIVCKNDISKK